MIAVGVACLAVVITPVVLAQSPAAKQMPGVSFTTPVGVAPSEDPYEWMLQPAYRKDLNKQMLSVTRAQDGPLASAFTSSSASPIWRKNSAQAASTAPGSLA